MRTITTAAAVIATAILAYTGLGAQSAPTKTQWDGVYTAEQAARGEPLYAAQCASCHGKNLEGGEMAPMLTSGDFWVNWDGETMATLMKRTHETMPPENPAGLTRRQVADILAFMLQREGAPAGTAELPTGADPLGAITFKAAKPAGK